MDRFLQEPPRLQDAWASDAIMREAVGFYLGEELFEQAKPHLAEMGRLVSEEATIALARRAESEPPTLTHYGTWGHRVDRITVSDAYTALGRLGVERGVASLPYEETPFGPSARVVWAALLNMWGPSSALYSCPIAMTDAAARTLLEHGGPEDLPVVQRLTSRDPDAAWTSGQWMTETAGGSDVGRTGTVARRDGDVWRLTGTKWFTSATTAEVALTLARPEGAAEGSRGLGLFRIHRELDDGTPNGIVVRRLKEKLGTRALPTAELELEDAVAHPVGDPLDGGGLRRIATMLNITRLHNALGATGSMARGLSWARSYASVREVFGARLLDQPAHRATLSELATDYAAALALTLRCAELVGRAEHGEASAAELAILRGLTPVAKLATARWAVANAAEAMEALGGVGYCEDSGMPALVRNAHVLPIWEGTTNVLALDLLRADRAVGAVDALLEDASAAAGDAGSGPAGELFRAIGALQTRIAEAGTDAERLQAAARPVAMDVARIYACALLLRQSRSGSATAADAAARLTERGLLGPPPPGALGAADAGWKASDRPR